MSEAVQDAPVTKHAHEDEAGSDTAAQPPPKRRGVSFADDGPAAATDKPARRVVKFADDSADGGVRPESALTHQPEQNDHSTVAPVEPHSILKPAPPRAIPACAVGLTEEDKFRLVTEKLIPLLSGADNARFVKAVGILQQSVDKGMAAGTCDAFFAAFRAVFANPTRATDPETRNVVVALFRALDKLIFPHQGKSPT